MAFVLKAILLDMSSATPDLLSCPLAWNIFSHPLPFNLYVSFALGWACLGSRLKVFALVPNLALCAFWWEHSVPEQFRWSLIDVSWLPFEALFSRWVYVSLFFFLFLWVDGFCSVDSLLESFPFPIFECSVGFWFGVALFCYYVSPFVCLLTLAWPLHRTKRVTEPRKRIYIFFHSSPSLYDLM